MATDVRIVFRAESQQAQRNIQTLRGNLAQLNRTLAEQRNQLIGATAEEQKNIRAHMAANNALKATIRSRIEQANLQKQAIAQTMKEARERERAAQQQIRASQQEARERERAAQQQVRASQQIAAAQRAVVQDLTIGARVVYQQLAQLTSGFVRAAADMETFRNTINVVTQDAEETNRILGDLLNLTVELVGIDTRDLINYAGRLMATGLSAEDAQTAIAGVTKRVAEQGKTAFTTRRVLEQFTQAINANHISYQDFRPILRELPTLYRDASNALGVQIKSLEDFRRATEAVGGPTQAILLVLEEMEHASEGANLDTLNANLDILKDLSRVLAAELGEHLIPAIVAIVKQINALIEAFVNIDDSVKAVVAWAVGLTTALTGLGVVVGTATVAFGALSASLSALTGVAGIAGLVASVGGLVASFAALAPYIAIGGIIIGGITLLGKAINDTSESARVLRTEITELEKVVQVYNLTTGQLEKLTDAQAKAYANFHESVADAQKNVQDLTSSLEENRAEQQKYRQAIENASSPRAFLVLQEDLDNLLAQEQEFITALEEAEDKLQGLKFEIGPTATEPFESLEEQLIRAVDQVIRLRDAFREASSEGSSTRFHDTVVAAEALTAALRNELSLQLEDAKLTAAERLALELETGREILKIHQDIHTQIRDQASEFNSFWEIAAAHAGNYTAAVDIATASVTNHAAELQALHNAGFFDGLDDPIADYVAGLQATSDAADTALGPLNRVGQSVRTADADFQRAEARLRDFDDAFTTLRSSAGDFTDVVDREITPATEDLTTALDTAKQTVEETENAFKNLDTIVAEVPDPVNDVRSAFSDLSDLLSDPNFFGGFLDVLGSINSELGDVADSVNNLISSAARGDGIAFLAEIPDLVRSLNQLQTDPNLATDARANRVFDVIDQIQGSDLSQAQQQELIEPLQAYIRELLTRSILSVQEAISPALIAQHESFARTRDLDFSFQRDRRTLGLEDVGFQTPFDLPEIDLSGVIQELQEIERLANAAKQRRDRGDGLGNPVLEEDAQARGPVRPGGRDAEARSWSERMGTDRQAIEDVARVQYGEAVYDAEVAAAQVAEGTATVAEDAAEILRNVHRFTSEENDILGGLRNAVSIAQEAVDRLDEGSTTEEITRAYQALTDREQALFDGQTGFIESAVGITETARTQALQQARIGFENRIASANAELVDALAGIGQELTTTITEWFTILQGSALAVQAIPAPVVPTEPPPVEPETDPRDTSLLRNRLDRAQFNVGLSESEADFEQRRGTLIRAINAFYDAELERIAEVADTETALQDLREDNQLARDRALQRALTATNTFAQERIRSEEQVAAAAEKAAQEHERATERAATAAAREAERQRQEHERAATAAAREAERQRREEERAARSAEQAAERQRRQSIGEASALDRNRVEQARFALDTAGSEAAFEERREALLQATNTYYDNELARIEDLGGSEAQLQDRREDNQLARARALQRISDLDNHFASERIRNEERVATAATRAAEQQRQERERAAAQAQREAERQAQEVRREAQRQAQAAERQRQREIAGASALDQNRVDRARFALGLSGSEQEFERNRRALIRATNAYYDNELERIEDLGGSEQELQDRREDNALAHERALEQALNTDNQFATERIRNEERAQQEIERLRDQEIAAETRRIEQIQDLRDAALDAERERHEDLIALEAETQERITDIQRKANQDREDIAREFSRDVEDNFREAQQEIAELLGAEGFSGGEIRDFLSGFEGDIRSRLSEAGRSQLGEIESQRFGTEVDLRRERDRDLEDAGIEEARQIEETRIQQGRERIAIDAELLQQQSQLNASMTALTEELSGLSATETVVAAAAEATTAAEQAASHALEAVSDIGRGIETANTAALTLDAIVEEVGSVADPLVRAATLLSQIEALPRFVEVVEALPAQIAANFEEVLGRRLITPLAEVLDTLKAVVSVPQSPGLLPIGIPVGQANAELFHYESTDAIARRLSRQAASQQPRAAPDYLPTSTQLKNAADLGREVISGFLEGVNPQSGGDGGFAGASQQAGLPEEINATVVLQWPDGATIELRDQMIRLQEQDRSL